MSDVVSVTSGSGGPAGGGGEPGGAGHALLNMVPETFWAVAIRRSKYVSAVALAALVFCTVGWKFAGPPPEYAGVSLMPMWSSHGLGGVFVLAVLLLVMTLVCSVLVHPDSPHMGLACALLGMAGLGIRGGTIHMLIRQGQQGGAGAYEKVAQGLAVECVQWGVIFLIAEIFSRLFHDRFLANTHWITRSGPELTESERNMRMHIPGQGAMGISRAVATKLGTHKLRRRVATPMGLVYSGVLAFLFLAMLMQTQSKGQVLMACFVAFFGSTLLTYLVFPRVPLVALLAVVPLTAAVGYVMGMHVEGYPGQAGFFAMRALPIDYVTAGVPGAIMGYYGGFRWSLHSGEEG